MPNFIVPEPPAPSIVDSEQGAFHQPLNERDTCERLSHPDTSSGEVLATCQIATAASLRPTDLWISRARPTFLYVIYGMILWAFPLGIIAAINPRMSHAIMTGMTDYLSALPDELYTLFATGYLGYATLRQWGKAKGTDV